MKNKYYFFEKACCITVPYASVHIEGKKDEKRRVPFSETRLYICQSTDP